MFNKRKKGSSDVMRVSEHLTELRNRLIVVFATFFVIALVGFNFAPDIVDFLIEVARKLNYQLIYISPSELFMQYIRLSVIGGVSIASPVILYEVWAFIKPGLKRSESTAIFVTLLGGLVFFILGVVFAFSIIVPFSLNFFATMDTTEVAATISIQNYIGFIITTLVSFGVVFELPVVIALLSQLGLMRPEWLTKSRRLVIVVIFVVGAIITPPDAISQVLVAIPMIVLYEISIIISKVIYRKKRKLEESEEY